MSVLERETKCYCNVLAMQKELDPVGYATDFDDAIIAEIPLPWKRNIYQQAGALPQEIIDLLQLWLNQYHEGIPYRHCPLMIAPDRRYSHHGFRRVMYYSRPEGAFARYTKIEYYVPEAQLGALVWALFAAPDALPSFEPYRDATHDATRDLLVCTHGTVDAACAKFGYPLYNYLRNNHTQPDLRVWRVSHFGGHVFAPTILDMPSGHYWAYVEEPQAKQIARQSGSVRDLYGHYRGWAGLEDGFLQAAERELWMGHGWEWFRYSKSGQVLARDEDAEDPKWADVQIEYLSPGSMTCETYTAHVEVHKHVTTSHSTGSDEEYPYPQYIVTEFEKTFTDYPASMA